MYILENLHNCGYVYNDLKLDNILLGVNQKLSNKDSKHGDCFKDLTLSLVDFGFSTPFICMYDGSHRPPSKCMHFRGNLLFGSKYQLNFDRTSRRDDLFSLFFLMIFIINRGNFPGVTWNHTQMTSKE